MKSQTLNEMLRDSVNLYGDRAAFKVKKDGKFAPITYKEFYNKVETFGTGLLGIGIEKFNHVGLVSDNRFEWIVTDMAIIGLRAADVPCSGNSSSQDIYFKLNHSEAQATILEGEKQFLNYLGIAIANITNILNPEMVVLVGGITNEGNKLLIPLREEVKKRAFYSNYKSLKIVIGKLGGNAGVLGAAALLWIPNNYSC